jgi:hypothetical protein
VSIEQRNDTCVITVGREVGAVVRSQSLAVLEHNHQYFEEVRRFGPEARRALAAIYRDAFAVLDAVGWGPPPDGPGGPISFAVPLTAGHMEQLARCRRDLGRTNLDRLDRDGPEHVDRAALDADREAAQVLDRLAAEFASACAG